MDTMPAQMRKPILDALAGRTLHCDQDVDEEAERAKRFMVLSVNSRYDGEFWIDGFGETIEDVLGVALGIDREWELEGIYDLLAIRLGKKDHIVSFQHGIRAVVGGIPTGDPVWKE